MSATVGTPLDRVDGWARVTGSAHYTADVVLPHLAHGVLVHSTVAKGRITRIDTAAAEAIPGIVGVFTHRNAPKLTAPNPPNPGQTLLPMQDEVIHYSGQHVAMVVAETPEQARHAATLIHIDYQAEQPVTRLADAFAEAYVPTSARERYDSTRGDLTTGFASAQVRIEATYTTPTHHHNAMEPSATVASWDGEQLTLYEPAQQMSRLRALVAVTLGIAADRIRVVSPFIGGSFGYKAYTWPHTALTAAIAKQLGRPIKTVLTRAQSFTSHGHRAEFHQTLRLGATTDGRLTAIEHITTGQTSRLDSSVVNGIDGTKRLYACPHVRVVQRLVRLDLSTPVLTRSPLGPGMHALETAMDELSYATGVDPVELRLRNHSDADPETDQPWPAGTKFLQDCYHTGAARFGWHRRDPHPRSMREGTTLIGWGMATAFHGAGAISPSQALAVLSTDGNALVQCGTQDVGTGTATVMTQIAADALGTPAATIRFELGDTDLPPGGPSGASGTVAGVAGPVHQACTAARDQVVSIAVTDPRSPLYGAAVEHIAVSQGRLFRIDDPGQGETYQQVLARHGTPVTARGDVPGHRGLAYGAVFAEVRVDPDLGQTRVSRVVAAYDAGRIINPKTARSQVIGGTVWGIGMALMEHTRIDPHHGRILTPNLSTYLLPVEADMPDIEVYFIDKPDPTSTALGTRGLGEVTASGTSAAIGNAIYHATARRVRDLPITPDRLL